MAKNGDSKTVGLRSGEPSPTEQGVLKLLTKWNAYLENIIKLIVYLIVLPVVVVAVVFTVVADRKRQIFLDPVTVPKSMEDEGYTGLVAANGVAVKISELQEDIRRKIKMFGIREKFEFNPREEPRPDFALPESGISITSAISFLEESFALAQPHVHAELVAAGGANSLDAAHIPAGSERFVISVELTGSKNYGSWTLVDVKTPDEAFRGIAREVLKIAEPYVMGIYENEDDQDHNVEDVLSLMERASDQDPSNPEIYAAWGWTLTSKGDFDGAIAKYQQALKYDDKYAHAYGYWGNTLLRKQDYEGAIAQCQQALKYDPNYADAYGYWGNALQSELNYVGAIEKYQQELRLEPESEYAHSDLGNALRGKGDYDGAIAEYIEQLEHHPKNAVAVYGNWGYTLLRKGDYDGAIAKYEHVLKSDRKNADAYSNEGCALQGKGDYDGAIEKYKLALKSDSNYVDAYSNWGNALQGKGDYNGAIEKYKVAFALDPKSADVYSNWGDPALLVAFECSNGC